MDEILSVKQAAKYLGYHENTVRNHLAEWGFFKMEGSRVWRVYKSTLDFLSKQKNNYDGLALSVGEEKLCRSKNEAMSITLTSQLQTVRELDALLRQP